jgi:predicted nucleic acid-binding Zn ribbon protein
MWNSTPNESVGQGYFSTPTDFFGPPLPCIPPPHALQLDPVNIDPHANYPVRECPGCAVEVPANENRCPICGYAFPARSALQRNLIWIVAALLALLLIPLFLSLR